MLAVMVPRGPVVLVGHSMGGMTVLSHARQFPQRYPTRIVGAALIASAAEGVSRSPLGEILKNPALEAVRFAARYAPKTGASGPRRRASLIGPSCARRPTATRRSARAVVAFSERMMHDTPIATLVEFLHALEVHDETAGLTDAGEGADADRLRRPRPADTDGAFAGHGRRTAEVASW